MTDQPEKKPETWINVYDFSNLEFGGKPEYQGRFLLEAATEYDGNEDRDDATATRHSLHRTKSGRWVRKSWTNWSGSVPRFWFISDDEARGWLVENGHDKAVTEFFGAAGEEGPPVRGRGRPPIGGRVETNLGEALHADVGRWARDNEVLHEDGRVNYSEAVRRLVADAFAHAVPATRREQSLSPTPPGHPDAEDTP